VKELSDGVLTVDDARRLIDGEWDSELIAYLRDNSTKRQCEIFTDDDYEHVAKCLKGVVAELFKLYPAGDLHPILKNDLFWTVGACDSTNVLALNLYVTFLYNCVPGRLLGEARK